MRQTIITGDGKGAKGFVTGTHGGIEHVIMYFDPAILDTLNIGDKVNVKAYGQGLKLLDYPEITVKNLDPDLLDKLNIEEKSGKLIVPVAKKGARQDHGFRPWLQHHQQRRLRHLLV